MADRSELLRSLPSVEEVLARLRAPGPGGEDGVSERSLAEAVRESLEARRQAILAAADEASLGSLTVPSREETVLLIAAEARERLAAARKPYLVPLINATGVVVHTNLGRSLLSAEAQRALLEAASRHTNLEYDLRAGRRGGRGEGVARLLRRLTGAEAATVVNNNAGAVFLALRALAEGREVVVSRGELVEIGGSFRIPDIMRASGARLIEVGTTNRTHLRDYEAAISPEAALLLKVHTSNFRILGFTAEVPLGELAQLARERELPLMADLGSGSLVDLAPHGLPGEPTVGEVLAAGADIVTFSGDKLLGGPQAGVAVGRRALVERLARHPLFRALRPDKLALAALEATLRAYLEPEAALREVPTLSLLTEPLSSVSRRARALLRRLRPEARRALGARLAHVESQVGGGALPLSKLPSRAVTLAPERLSAAALDARLRALEPPVVARIQEQQVVLDMRTVRPEEVAPLARSLARLAEELLGPPNVGPPNGEGAADAQSAGG
ncbi:MAG: L-seryl-tRNA(Sec) selenium transferase [Nitrospinota bacterium]